MNFEIRRISKEYLSVIVHYWGTSVDMGILSEAEASELANNLEEAVDELNSGWENTND